MKAILAVQPDFFTNQVGFYLDKHDPPRAAIQPKSRVWRTKGKGLAITAKRSKNLAGGKRLHVLVAVAYKKGVILHEVYEKMDGEFLRTLLQVILIYVLVKRAQRLMARGYSLWITTFVRQVKKL